MVLIISDKKNQFEVSQIGNIHNELNEYYNKVFAYQNDSKEYQDILSKFAKLLDNLYQIIQQMERFNNNNKMVGY